MERKFFSHVPKQIKKALNLTLLISFLVSQAVYAAPIQPMELGSLVQNAFISAYNLPSFKFLSVNPLNPNNYFNFLLDKGDGKLATVNLNKDAKQLLNYFFIGISLPNDNFWVNLNPNEPNRILSESLAKTDLGKVMLESDLQLKKNAARILHPKHPKGKLFWDKFYARVGRNNDVNLSNRLWIVPDKAELWQTKDGVMIVNSSLKVVTENEYLKQTPNDQAQIYSDQLLRELIIPEITKEVNTSKAFANLRQVYNSLILAQWYKKNYINKDAKFSNLIDKGITPNLESKLPWSKQAIWQNYVNSFKQGEYNWEEVVGDMRQAYVSGGESLVAALDPSVVTAASPANVAGKLASSSITQALMVGEEGNIQVLSGQTQYAGAEKSTASIGSAGLATSPAASNRRQFLRTAVAGAAALSAGVLGPKAMFAAGLGESRSLFKESGLEIKGWGKCTGNVEFSKGNPGPFIATIKPNEKQDNWGSIALHFNNPLRRQRGERSLFLKVGAHTTIDHFTIFVARPGDESGPGKFFGSVDITPGTPNNAYYVDISGVFDYIPAIGRLTFEIGSKNPDGGVLEIEDVGLSDKAASPASSPISFKRLLNSLTFSLSLGLFLISCAPSLLLVNPAELSTLAQSNRKLLTLSGADFLPYAQTFRAGIAKSLYHDLGVVNNRLPAGSLIKVRMSADKPGLAMIQVVQGSANEPLGIVGKVAVTTTPQDYYVYVEGKPGETIYASRLAIHYGTTAWGRELNTEEINVTIEEVDINAVSGSSPVVSDLYKWAKRQALRFMLRRAFNQAVSDAGESTTSRGSRILAGMMLGSVLPFALPVAGIVQAAQNETEQRQVKEVVNGILALMDKNTGLPVSHTGQDNMKDWLFTYDAAVVAMVLNATGHKKEAERMLDYIAERYGKFSAEDLGAKTDVNGYWGIVKVFRAPYGQKRLVKGMVSAISNVENSTQGAAREWRVGPGPTAWLMNAMIEVNFNKYRNVIEQLADSLLALQAPDGGFRGDVSDLGKTHTEPHMDAMNVMEKLYALTKKEIYRDSAKRAQDWFMANALDKDKGIIYQGIWNGSPNPIHATDVYTWPLTIVGDRLPLELIKRLIARVEDKSLVQITYKRADGKETTVIGVDFTNPQDSEIKRVRGGGYNPMTIPEWTAGMSLMDYVTSLRFMKGGDNIYATELVAIGDALRYYAWLMGVEENGAVYFPYATGKWIATGHGWFTPIGDRSLSGYWLAFPTLYYNPFEKNGGNLAEEQPSLPTTPLNRAVDLLGSRLKNPSFAQGQKLSFPEEATIPWTSQNLIKVTWDAYVKGESTGNQKDFEEAIRVAKIGIQRWSPEAREQQRIKEREVGGPIAYPWGRRDENAFNAVWKYPLLNEVAALEWILAASYFQIGDRTSAKAHIKEIIENYSYGQIYDPAPGFWYPIRSWELLESGKQLDKDMSLLYREVLQELGRKGGVPKEVNPTTKAPAESLGESMPAPLAEEPYSPKPPSKAEAPKEAATGKVVATGIDGTWSGSGAFSCWKLGPFDLSKAKSLRIVFSRSQSGTNIYVRLLPEGANPSDRAGLQSKGYTIPADGVVNMPASDFVGSNFQLKTIQQISIHSGTNAWGMTLEQGANKQATFERIDVVGAESAGSKGEIVSPQNVIAEEPYSPKPTAKAETPKETAAGKVIATGIDGTWAGGGAFSCWKLGPFDLSKAKSLRVSFPVSKAGTKVFIRLLPDGGSPGSPTGLNKKAYTIPKDGSVVVPISEFPLSSSELKQIIQISVHSGTNAWSYGLEQSADRQATFNSVEVINSGSSPLENDSASSPTTSLPVGSEQKIGGIDLGKISFNIEDCSKVFSSNPVDDKILRAAEMLKRNWNAVSVLYLQEAMLLLKYNIVKEFSQRDLAIQLLSMLRVKEQLDESSLDFLNILQAGRPIEELKLAFVSD